MQFLLFEIISFGYFSDMRKVIGIKAAKYSARISRQPLYVIRNDGVFKGKNEFQLSLLNNRAIMQKSIKILVF